MEKLHAAVKPADRPAPAPSTPKATVHPSPAALSLALQPEQGARRALADTSAGEALEAHLAADLGSRSADVRVHTDSSAAHLAADVQADAFTRGRDIYFGAGRYEPTTEAGRRLLRHELGHVAQQARGEVPGAFAGRIVPHTDPSEADAASGAALMRPAPAHHAGLVAIQRQPAGSSPADEPAVSSSAAEPEPVPAGPPPRSVPGSLRIRVVAHASPRWRSAGSAREADEDNLALSRKRAEEVRDLVTLRMQYLLGDDVSTTYEVDYGVTDPPGSVALTSEAHGSQETLREAKGNRAANDPWYRRVDVYIDDVARTEKYAGRSETPGTHKVEKKSRWWQVSVGVSWSASLGLAAGGLALKLRNPYTGREGTYHVVGGGGAGPGVSVGYSLSSDYSDFFTDEEVGFEEFDQAIATYESYGAGIVFVGYQWSNLTITGEGMGSGAQKIDVSGWNVGAHLDLGAGAISGPLRADGIGPPSDWYDVPWPDVGWTPYQESRLSRYLHSALFRTGSPQLSACERRELRRFVDAAAGRWSESPPPVHEPEPCPVTD